MSLIVYEKKKMCFSYTFFSFPFLFFYHADMCTRVQLLCTKKKVILRLASFLLLAHYCGELFFLSSVLSLLFCLILIHSIRTQKMCMGESVNGPTAMNNTHTHIYTYTSRSRQRREWPDSCSLYVCPQSLFFYVYLPVWWEKSRRKFIIVLFNLTTLIYV